MCSHGSYHDNENSCHGSHSCHDSGHSCHYTIQREPVPKYTYVQPCCLPMQRCCPPMQLCCPQVPCCPQYPKNICRMPRMYPKF
ncbi:putative small proline-rich protein 5 [Nyctibius grandis]|uniref:putative small proline-rich protein 5 n=1 Tax=Nyctibius grandis TaxID=48427 RepID=UPI0035BBC570